MDGNSLERAHRATAEQASYARGLRNDLVSMSAENARLREALERLVGPGDYCLFGSTHSCKDDVLQHRCRICHARAALERKA